jgi:membrane protein YdbS with pleckstrin-like domain
LDRWCIIYDQQRIDRPNFAKHHCQPSVVMRGATIMVVVLNLIRLALIGVGLYMLYLTAREFPAHPDWLMLSALLLNLAYLFAVPRLSRLMKLWFEAEEQELKTRTPCPLLEVTNTAPGIMESDVVASQDHSGHRLALRLKLREVAP